MTEFTQKTDPFGTDFVLYEVNYNDDLLDLRTFLDNAKNNSAKKFVIVSDDSHEQKIRSEIKNSGVTNVKLVKEHHYKAEAYCAEIHKITPEAEIAFNIINQATGNRFNNSIMPGGFPILFDGIIKLLEAIKK